MTTLQIVLIVWRVVTKIEIDKQLSVANDDDSIESENECDYAKCLFDALDSASCYVKRRGDTFSIDLIEMVEILFKMMTSLKLN